MSIKPWKVLESNRPQKYLRVDKCELPGGDIIEKLILEFGTWITVVAITPQQEVVMIKQYRHGAGKVIWEFPAGVVDPGESPAEAAVRELLEESGYALPVSDNDRSDSHFILTGVISPNPDNHTNLIHTFLALDVHKVSEQELDPNEEIDVYLVPLKEVIRMAMEGELLQSMQISALFFALQHLEKIN